MFTGLIESVGIVSDVVPTASGFTLTIRTPMGLELRQGESVAVNGVCLTATTCSEAGWTADIGPETARVTTLGTLAPGRPVNLERSMRADGRFGGHFVQGHVDGVGVVDAIRQDGESYWIAVRIPADLEPYVILKGSIALEGVIGGLRDTLSDVHSGAARTQCGARDDHSVHVGAHHVVVASCR